MIRLLLSTLLLAASLDHCLAALPFACKASGDSWSVVGAPDHKLSCALRCILRDAAGNQDTVSCSPLVSPGPRAEPLCEGFLLGKHWTSATLAAAECAAVAP